MKTNRTVAHALVLLAVLSWSFGACVSDQTDDDGGPAAIGGSGSDADADSLEGPDADDPDGNAAGSEDGGDGGFLDGGSDSGDGESQTCGGGEHMEMCKGSCVNTQKNEDHCGSCKNACGEGGIHCFKGECECIAPGASNCNGKCVNLQTNDDYCGRCKISCDGGEKCENGTCRKLTQVEAVIRESNEIRAQGYDCDRYGEKPPVPDVSGNSELHEAAQKYAETMADANANLSHYYNPETGAFACDPMRPDCRDFAWRIGQTDYQGQPVSENIARGQDTAEQVVIGWAKSDGHCRNLLSSRPNEIGVGYAVSSRGQPYWVQVFGKQ